MLAQRSRWGRAPALNTRCQRGEASNARYALYVRIAMAMPSWLRSKSGTFPVTAASQRLMNSEATDPTLGLSPASMRRSMPRKNASAAAT